MGAACTIASGVTGVAAAIGRFIMVGTPSGVADITEPQGYDEEKDARPIPGRASTDASRCDPGAG